MSSPIITLLTDFGSRDGFVGTMKGVILSICPEAKIVDISHEIEPQNIAAAAFVLSNSVDYFPEGTIHVVVIDPGVGSERRILCVCAGKHFFLAPDNGVLKYIYNKEDSIKAIHVSNRKYFLLEISQTFHGRDIFAPVAAHLANGLDFKQLGKQVNDFAKGQLPQLLETGNGLIGEIVYIDRFGNLVSNIPSEKILPDTIISVGEYTIRGLADSYSQGQDREPIGLIGSSGYLEIAMNLGSAKEYLKCSEGEKIEISFIDLRKEING